MTEWRNVEWKMREKKEMGQSDGMIKFCGNVWKENPLKRNRFARKGGGECQGCRSCREVCCSLVLFLFIMASLAGCGKADAAGGDSGRDMEAAAEGEAGQAGLDWQDQYDLGIRLFGEGKYEEAIIAFTAVIEIDARNTDAYLGRAEAYMAMGDVEENLVLAQTDLCRAMELDSTVSEEAGAAGKLAEICGKLADFYDGQGDWQAARDILQQEYDVLGESVWATSQDFQEKLDKLGLELWEDTSGAGILFPSLASFDVLSAGSVTEYYYLTEGERKAVLGSVLEKAQFWCEKDPEDTRGSYDYVLAIMANACYRLGDLEKVKELRAVLYQRTGEEQYQPGYERAAGDGVTEYYNEYGLLERTVYGDGSEELWEYDGNGKPVKMTVYSGDWFEFHYEDGRLAEEPRYDLEAGGELYSRVVFEYQGDMVSMVTHVYLDGVTELRSYRTTFQLDELGNPMWETRQDE